MTVHHRNEEARERSFPSVSPSTKKNHWPVMGNDSSSWDRNSRATSSSWPGESEEAATRKILQLWHGIERDIYGENDEIIPDPSNEECNQWRSQLVHLRIIGKGASSFLNDESNEIERSSGRKSGTIENRFSEEIFIEDSRHRSQDLSENSRRNRRLAEDEKDVFDQILEYVCTELARQDDENKESLSENLDEVLRITPAPTYSGRKWSNGRTKLDKSESRKASANGSRSGLEQLLDLSDVVSGTKDRLENDNVEIDGADIPLVPRNKLGTIFNEKIVVSPVPFVVSTRESFTTLRTTPISFRAQNFKISSSQGFGRYMNSASMTNSGQRIAPSRISQIHSAWQAPVCPAVWPKNIKLAPIDPSRLPSSKNRSSIDSMAGLPHRNRNSLSPILRPIKPVASANQRNNNIEGLEIQGKQIVTRSPKKNLPKAGWDCSPRNLKNTRITKPRTTKR